MRWHSTDPWRGYSIPDNAVVGSSDTGTWSDSPCPTPLVTEELAQARKVLRAAKIRSRHKVTRSSNVFMVKRWLCVQPDDADRARALMADFLRTNPLRFLHDAC